MNGLTVDEINDIINRLPNAELWFPRGDHCQILAYQDVSISRHDSDSPPRPVDMKKYTFKIVRARTGKLTWVFVD